MPRAFPAIRRNLLLFPVLLLCAGWAGAAGAACSALAAANAWVPAAPPGATVMAGYFQATNTGAADVELTAVSSPQFERTHMHRSVVDDSGTASMQPVASVTLTPGETVTFGPGGYHVMLFQPLTPLKAGDTVTLALHCGDAEASLSVTADVRSRLATGEGSSHRGPMHDMRHGDTGHGADHGGMSMDHDMDHGPMHHGS